MTHRQPEQSYYPRWRLRLLVRFEEWGADDTPDPPKLPPQNRRGPGKDPGQAGSLVVLERDGRLELTEPATPPQATWGGPQDQTTSADGRTFAIDGVIPLSATVALNGVRQADTLSAVVQFRDFPFDPRAVRSCGVQFYLGCISADDADRGSRGDVRSDATIAGDALPFQMIPDTYVDGRGRARSNLRFEGWVDVQKIALDESSGTVSFECTDNTALFIDQPAPPRLTVSAKKPIDRAVAEYLACFPQFRGMSVEYRPGTEDSLKPVLGRVISATAQAKPGEGPAPSGSTKMSVWDYLTDVCGMVGHVCRVDGTTVIIQRARTLLGGTYARGDDPFTGRQLEAEGEPPLLIPARLFAYGVNVRSFEVERKWRRREAMNVEVRSYSTNRKKTIIVRFPAKGDRTKSLRPGQAAELKFEVHRVDGIEDEDTLRIVAQSIFEQKNRNEVGVAIETKNLASFGGDNLDPDVLDIREGDPVRVEVARRPNDTEVNTIDDASRGDFSSITALGFGPAVAGAYERARAGVAFPTTFRLQTGAIDVDQTEGVSIKLNLINYIEVRMDKPLPSGKEPTPPTRAPVDPTVVRVNDEVG